MTSYLLRILMSWCYFREFLSLKYLIFGWTFVCKILLENRDLIFPSVNYGANELMIAWGEPILV